MKICGDGYVPAQAFRGNDEYSLPGGAESGQFERFIGIMCDATDSEGITDTDLPKRMFFSVDFTVSPNIHYKQRHIDKI